MFHGFVPTLEKPNRKSPSWYITYHSSFYMSQLVNNALLSYVESFIGLHEEEMIDKYREKLLKEGILKNTSQNNFEIDKSRLYSIEVEACLNDVARSFQLSANNLQDHFSCMGINIGNYLERPSEIDIYEIAKTTDNKCWYDILKGFLNLWEFMFLFSITESTLKNFSDKKTGTAYLVNNVMSKHPGIGIGMKNNHRISEDLCSSMWKAFTSIRNIYAHTHGIISGKDRNSETLTNRILAFREHYNEAFHNIKEPSDMIIDTFMPEASNLFKEEEMKTGKFYFIPDIELNIFRNFVSELITLLSKETESPINS